MAPANHPSNIRRGEEGEGEVGEGSTSGSGDIIIVPSACARYAAGTPARDTRPVLLRLFPVGAPDLELDLVPSRPPTAETPSGVGRYKLQPTPTPTHVQVQVAAPSPVSPLHRVLVSVGIPREGGRRGTPHPRRTGSCAGIQQPQPQPQPQPPGVRKSESDSESAWGRSSCSPRADPGPGDAAGPAAGAQ